ncbi:AAA family ATPase [Meiothermus granaticius]|uniref:Trifunctional NAD biosynthesis/regulator protein NadR n=1 Tax=Meiothermus granaticius NBRC 107808 TaxID=1227551 RepID=A0A399FBH5_9DEIN|nr:AAA family ATPase [Meiothermus granaticius]RIH92021.1 Trifunctional NAD biosynthesis/regulator protein NadR [Meiothermus granaticius NBRC 107808]GEM86883.1 hypothetical protein MGR01S_15080 [Meiothermus granaticius NBRC 107808]
MGPDRRRTGLIVGKFAPPHKGHQLLIETALEDENIDQLIVLVYANPDFPEMPTERRAAWIRELYPSAKIYVPENPPPDAADDFTQREFVKGWLELHHIRADRVYSSEAYGEGFARHIGAKHVPVDPERKRFPISGTRVRELLRGLAEGAKPDVDGGTWMNPHLLGELETLVGSSIHRHLLHQLDPVKKVVFLGAESTGKSTLTQRMAEEFSTEFVAEYGREVYERNGGVMRLEDYVHIAREHRRLEDSARVKAWQHKERGSIEGQPYLFVDTNAITTLFFSYYYHQTARAELHQLANACKDRYHHVFVCADDIPFEQDGWRDNAVWRSRMQGLVLHDLDCRGVVYTVLHGNLDERVRQVKAALKGQKAATLEAELPQLGPKS